MDFALSDEQRLLVETRRFVASEIFPHEEAVDRAGSVPPELGKQIAERHRPGLFAANMPECRRWGPRCRYAGAFRPRIRQGELVARRLCRAAAADPARLPGEQIERYLLPTVRGERKDCFALTEPGAGSDAMAITTRAVRDGGDYRLNGTKHFISGVGVPDFAIVFAGPARTRRRAGRASRSPPSSSTAIRRGSRSAAAR